MKYSKRILSFAFLSAVSLQLLAMPGDTISLNEKWLFKLYPSRKSVPSTVQGTSFNDTQWGFQSIPGQWKVSGSQRKNNYVGVYRGWIKMPPTFKGRRVYLHVGNASAVASLYMNGTLLGTTAADRAQTEVDITSHLKPGRNLFAIVMPHWGDDETTHDASDHSGLLSSCFIYGLSSGQEPAAEYVPVKAAAGARVADRNSFEPVKGYIDSPELMQKDVDEMKRMGFTAVTYNKAASDPRFISVAQQNQMPVVSDAPMTSEALLDANRQPTAEAYALLPAADFDYKKEASAREKKANAVVAKPKAKKKETEDLLTLWDTPYSIQFDKHTGLISSYTLGGVSVISSGSTLMPNARRELKSFTSTKPGKGDCTKVTAVFTIDGQDVTWVYEVYNSGVLKVRMSGPAQQLLVSFSPQLTHSTFLANDFGGTRQLDGITGHRPGIIYLQQTNDQGRGVELLGEHELVVRQTAKNTQWLLDTNDEDFRLSFYPE